MSLSDSKVGPAVPVSDVSRAKEFYEGKLGLSAGRDVADGGTTYTCGGGTEIHIYPSPENAGKSGATLVGWEVDDLEKAVDELSANGVSFEQYDSDPIKTDEKGIAQLGDDQIAWFKDPDGNIHGIAETS